MNGEHRTRGAGYHLVGHAAEEDPLQALAAVGAHDNQINFLFFGQLQDLGGRITRQNPGLQFGNFRKCSLTVAAIFLLAAASACSWKLWMLLWGT